MEGTPPDSTPAPDETPDAPEAPAEPDTSPPGVGVALCGLFRCLGDSDGGSDEGGE